MLNHSNKTMSSQSPFDDSANMLHSDDSEKGYNSDATVEEELPQVDKAITDDHTNKKRSPLETVQSHSRKKSRQNTQWPDDVQNAFEEAIQFVPKTQTKTNKLHGFSLGRNQYICMYIQHQTGVHRTPKQVSSHIQGLCSSKRNYPLKQLLIDGPPDEEEVSNKFRRVFSQITMPNTPKADARATRTISGETDDFAKMTRNILSFSKPKTQGNKLKPFLTLKKLDMCYVNFNILKDSHVFSKIDDCFVGVIIPNMDMTKTLLMEKYYNLSRLILDSNEGETIQPRVPFVISDVNFNLPVLSTDLISGNYNFTAKFTLSNMPRDIPSYTVITEIMIGNRITNTFVTNVEYSSSKSRSEHNLTLDIGSAYWRSYIVSRKQLYSDIDDMVLDINSTNIRQILIDSRYSKTSKFDYNRCDKSAVKCIFVWNFVACQDAELSNVTMKNINEVINTFTPKRIVSSGSHPFSSCLQLNTPLSVIAEQRQFNTKIGPISQPLKSLDSPLIQRTQPIIQKQLALQNSLATPPHNTLLQSPLSLINQNKLNFNFPQPGSVLFKSEKINTIKGEDANTFIPSTADQGDICNANSNLMEPPKYEDAFVEPHKSNVELAGLGHTLEAEKENIGLDSFEQSFDDYKSIFSDPNSMYDFI